MAIEAQGTLLQISGGTGTSKNITGITKGAITKVASTSHGFKKGEAVIFANVGGMIEINGKTAIIVAVETDAFYVNINSTGYGTYTSGGTATPPTWVDIGEAVDYSGPTGSASVIDITHLQSIAKEKLMGLADEGQFTLSLNRVFSDIGQMLCWEARAERLKKNFKITYKDSTTAAFAGYVLEFSTSGGVDDKVSGSITIEIDGPVTFA